MVHAALNSCMVDLGKRHAAPPLFTSILPLFPKLEGWGRLMSYLLSNGRLGIVSLSLCRGKHTLSPLDHPGALVGWLLKSPGNAIIFYDLPENTGCGEATEVHTGRRDRSRHLSPSVPLEQDQQISSKLLKQQVPFYFDAIIFLS